MGEKKEMISTFSETQIFEIHEDIICKTIESLKETFLNHDTDLNVLNELEELWRISVEKLKPDLSTTDNLQNDSNIEMKPCSSRRKKCQNYKKSFMQKQMGKYKLVRIAVSNRELTRQEIEKKIQENIEYEKNISGIGGSKNIRQISLSEIVHLSENQLDLASSKMHVRLKGKEDFCGKNLSIRQTDGAVSDDEYDDDDYNNDDEKNSNYFNDSNYVINDDVSKFEKIEESNNWDIIKMKGKKVDVQEELFQRDYSDSEKDDEDSESVEELSQKEISKIKKQPDEDSENYDCSDEEDINKSEEIAMDKLEAKQNKSEEIVECSSMDEELNSDDDLDGIHDWSDCENTIYCTSARIKKTKKAHKFTIQLKNGLMNTKGKDYAFKSLNCKPLWFRGPPTTN